MRYKIITFLALIKQNYTNILVISLKKLEKLGLDLSSADILIKQIAEAEKHKKIYDIIAPVVQLIREHLVDDCLKKMSINKNFILNTRKHMAKKILSSAM